MQTIPSACAALLALGAADAAHAESWVNLNGASTPAEIDEDSITRDPGDPEIATTWRTSNGSLGRSTFQGRVDCGRQRIRLDLVISRKGIVPAESNIWRQVDSYISRTHTDAARKRPIAEHDLWRRYLFPPPDSTEGKVVAAVCRHHLDYPSKERMDAIAREVQAGFGCIESRMAGPTCRSGDVLATLYDATLRMSQVKEACALLPGEVDVMHEKIKFAAMACGPLEQICDLRRLQHAVQYLKIDLAYGASQRQCLSLLEAPYEDVEDYEHRRADRRLIACLKERIPSLSGRYTSVATLTSAGLKSCIPVSRSGYPFVPSFHNDLGEPFGWARAEAERSLAKVAQGRPQAAAPPPR